MASDVENEHGHRQAAVNATAGGELQPDTSTDPFVYKLTADTAF